MIGNLVGYVVHAPEVERFHRSPARTRIVSAPARTSKSFAAAYDHLPLCFPWRDERTGGKYMKSVLGWIVCPTFTMSKEWDYLWTELHDRAAKNNWGYQVERRLNNPNQGHMQLVLNWGRSRQGEWVRTVIECKSASNEQTLQGEEVDWCIMSEAAEMEERIYRRYLSTRCKKITIPTTPKLKAAWLAEMIELGQSEPQLGIESFQFTGRCNPTYDWERFWEEHGKAESRVLGRVATAPYGHDCFDPGLIECKAMRDPWFGEQFGGLWTGESERVLPFTEETNVIHEPPAWFDYAQRFLGVDYGFNDHAVAHWWALGPDDTKIIYREIYATKLNPSAFVELIRERTEESGERLQYCCGDPSRPEVEDIMRKLGLPVVIRNKNAMRDRAAGLLQLVDQLTVDPKIGLPKLRVASENFGEGMGAPKTISEWKVLRRKGSRDEFSAGSFAGADHAFDAARYFLQSRPRRKFLTATGQELAEHKRWIRQLRRHQPQLKSYPLMGGSPATMAGVA